MDRRSSTNGLEVVGEWRKLYSKRANGLPGTETSMLGIGMTSLQISLGHPMWMLSWQLDDQLGRDGREATGS